MEAKSPASDRQTNIQIVTSLQKQQKSAMKPKQLKKETSLSKKSSKGNNIHFFDLNQNLQKQNVFLENQGSNELYDKTLRLKNPQNQKQTIGGNENNDTKTTFQINDRMQKTGRLSVHFEKQNKSPNLKEHDFINDYDYLASPTIQKNT